MKKLLLLPTAAALAWLWLHGTAVQWRERARRIPLPAFSAAQPPQLRQPAKVLQARELERLELEVTSDVVALAESKDVLYAGTFDDGLFRIQGGSQTRLAIDPRVNDLAVDADGTLYAATAEGAYRNERRLAVGAFSAVAIWRGEPFFASRAGLSVPSGDGLWTRGPLQGFRPDGLNALAGCGLALCIGANDGLWLFDGSLVSRAKGELPEEMVTAVARDGDTLWAGTMARGIARLSPGNSFIPPVPDGRVVPHALVVQDGAILFGTPEGLVVVRGGQAGIVRELAPVTALAASDRGGVWVGVRNAAVRVELLSPELVLR